jgi:L-ascorbate metabolism protein UlaG (beta-lactamase superfamily)
MWHPPAGRLAGLASALLFLSVSGAVADVRVTYLANEGVHLESGACSVLIDALLRDSLDDYRRHPPEVQEKLETARPPFDRVRLALATHFHLDHWDAGAIARFLSSSPAAVFAAPPQAGVMLPTSLKPRVRALWAEPSQTSVRLTEPGVVVDAIPLDHGMAVENLAYRVQCGERVLFHLGDAAPTEANFARLLAAGAADVALVPFWWITSDAGLAFLKDRWQPRQMVALHLGAEEATAAAERIRQRLPRAWIPLQPGDARSYP